MGVLLCLGSTLPAMAQNYDPENPPEPYLNNMVTVTASPKEAVSWLSGSGYHKPGDIVRLSASGISDRYTFQYWEKDGKRYSDVLNTTYTMESEPVTFTAVFVYTFVFDPESPAEPELDDNRLFIVAEPLTACSFNIDILYSPSDLPMIPLEIRLYNDSICFFVSSSSITSFP